MGRPISKKFLGNPAKPGNQITLTSAWVAGEVGPSAEFYILRQVGTGRYQVTDGNTVGVVRLVDGEPLSAGKACLAVYPWGIEAPVEYARVLHNRTVKTFQDNRYKWSFDSAAADGEADLINPEPPVVTPAPAPAPAPAPTPAPSSDPDTGTGSPS